MAVVQLPNSHVNPAVPPEEFLAACSSAGGYFPTSSGAALPHTHARTQKVRGTDSPEPLLFPGGRPSPDWLAGEKNKKQVGQRREEVTARKLPV